MQLVLPRNTLEKEKQVCGTSSSGVDTSGVKGKDRSHSHFLNTV